MSTEDAIYQAALDWLKAANGLADDEVIRSDQHAPRPELPYATVKVTTYDQQVGTDEQIRGENGSKSTVKLRGLRRGQLSVQTFGGVGGWIEQARQYLQLPPVRSALHQGGIDFRPQSAIQEVGKVVDPSYEPRHQADFQVVYQVESPEVDQGPGATGVAFSVDFPNLSFSESYTLE